MLCGAQDHLHFRECKRLSFPQRSTSHLCPVPGRCVEVTWGRRALKGTGMHSLSQIFMPALPSSPQNGCAADGSDVQHTHTQQIKIFPNRFPASSRQSLSLWSWPQLPLLHGPPGCILPIATTWQQGWWPHSTTVAHEAHPHLFPQPCPASPAHVAGGLHRVPSPPHPRGRTPHACVSLPARPTASGEAGWQDGILHLPLAGLPRCKSPPRHLILCLYSHNRIVDVKGGGSV